MTITDKVIFYSTHAKPAGSGILKQYEVTYTVVLDAEDACDTTDGICVTSDDPFTYMKIFYDGTSTYVLMKMDTDNVVVEDLSDGKKVIPFKVVDGGKQVTEEKENGDDNNRNN